MRLSKEEVLKYQQNKPPYLMIDEAEEVIPGKSAKGYKYLDPSEWFFKVHWPTDPNMPGMLQIESLVQMCALSLLTLPGNKGKLVYIISANNLVFKRKSSLNLQGTFFIFIHIIIYVYYVERK